MMLIGRVFRENAGWSAHCDAVGVYTQGPSRGVAVANLAEAIELQANRHGLKISVSDLDGESVFVAANDSALLAGAVLRHQREMHGLSLSDVARKLGAASVNAYAAYEQGKREPSLSKFRELLGVVAPEMVLTLRSRLSGPGKRKAKVAR